LSWRYFVRASAVPVDGYGPPTHKQKLDPCLDELAQQVLVILG
jgi:hypothetical protein